jgi:hypothetical protein
MEQSAVLELPSLNSPVPSYRSTVSETERVPVWAREVAASLQDRQNVSRASSIISTRTKTSTDTAQEDARSVDLNIDGIYFRINRDGSRVTTSDYRDTLPPYSPKIEAGGTSNGCNRDEQGLDASDGQLVTTEMAHQGPEILRHLQVPRSQYPSYRHLGDPSSIVARDIGATADTSLSRNLSFTPGKDIISVAKKRTVSQNDIPNVIPRKPLDLAYRLRRRNGIRLPTLVTNLTNDTDDQQDRSSGGQYLYPASASPHGQYPHSADPILGNDTHSFIQRPRSPMFIGRDAPGLFPSPSGMTSFTQPPPLSDDQTTVGARTPIVHEEGYADTYPPPPMESENDISVHYTRLIRTIDRDNRKALHERDKEMATLRERLNEQDTIYRQQLRARDFIIDDLKNRIAHLESTTEATVERACNSIEDTWENRWKDRDFHLMERMQRLENDLMMERQRFTPRGKNPQNGG